MATSKPSHKIFVNLAVRDLQRTKAFFSSLGFEFNAQFTNDDAACMIISDGAYVMLLGEPHFEKFAARPLSDATQQTEGIYAVSCESRAEVDAMTQKALAAGGTPALEPQDHGFMYSQSFYDPDGHHWELFWMDPAAVQ